MIPCAIIEPEQKNDPFSSVMCSDTTPGNSLAGISMPFGTQACAEAEKSAMIEVKTTEDRMLERIRENSLRK